MLTSRSAPLEMWGGIEATVNRVGDTYFDQMARNGHIDRIEDLDLFAELGIRAIRYPVLWELVAPEGLAQADWRWPDARLQRLRELGVRPIVGLVHHGSGPKHTSLVDPNFPEQLAEYAAAVAERYPWINDYTPVNEPLTTARFSALYGHWYPHERDDLSFARALINECRGVILSMQAIRDVNPNARLIQTEEIGRIHSTRAIAAQAEFENERRWLTFDLLTGGLTEERPLWRWLLEAGVAREELEWFRANPCPPDILGVNYYLSSERFLDDRLDLYPEEPAGGNGTHTYVDILAARVLPEGIGGIEPLLMEVWDRYHRPMSITEVHNGGTRDEQLRWLHEVWHGALGAHAKGADLRAVTVWALLGSHDWPSLVTRDDGIYEPGVFDIRSPLPRPTAIAHMTRALAIAGTYHHPVLDVPGWWRRPDRFYNLPSRLQPTSLEPGGSSPVTETPQHILIVGDNPVLAEHFTSACQNQDRHVWATTTTIADPSQLQAQVEACRAWAIVISESGLGSPDYPVELLEAVLSLGDRLELPVVVFSSAAVGPGKQDRPLVESDVQAPVAARDRALLKVERQILDSHPKALIVRTGPLFSIESHAGLLLSDLDDTRYAPGDVISPTCIEEMADVVIELLLDGECGIWHIANTLPVTWEAFRSAIGDPVVVARNQNRDTGSRPSGSVNSRMRALSSERGWFLSDWRKGLTIVDTEPDEVHADLPRNMVADD